MNDNVNHHAQQRTGVADPPSSHNAVDEKGTGTDRGSPTTYPGTPRWVKASLIVALVLVLLFVGMHLIGMRPGHGGPTPPTEHGVQRPEHGVQRP